MNAIFKSFSKIINNNIFGEKDKTIFSLLKMLFFISILPMLPLIFILICLLSIIKYIVIKFSVF